MCVYIKPVLTVLWSSIKFMHIGQNNHSNALIQHRCWQRPESGTTGMMGNKQAQSCSWHNVFMDISFFKKIDKRRHQCGRWPSTALFIWKGSLQGDCLKVLWRCCSLDSWTMRSCVQENHPGTRGVRCVESICIAMCIYLENYAHKCKWWHLGWVSSPLCLSVFSNFNSQRLFYYFSDQEKVFMKEF